jgi:hypothetical protein
MMGDTIIRRWLPQHVIRNRGLMIHLFNAIRPTFYGVLMGQVLDGISFSLNYAWSTC